MYRDGYMPIIPIDPAKGDLLALTNVDRAFPDGFV
jgi:hypothetical protein